MFLILLILLFSKNNYAFVAQISGRSFNFDKFMANCENEKNILGNYSVTNLRHDTKNVTYDVSGYVGSIVKECEVELSFRRCASIEALDSCRMVHKLGSKNGCYLMTAKNQVWTPAISCLKPKVACPILKDVYYYGTGCSVDLSIFHFIPVGLVGRYYWKAQMKISLPTKETIICFSFAGQLMKRT